MCRKSNGTPPGFGVGGGVCIGGGVGVANCLIFIIFTVKCLCDGQDAVRRVILFADRSFCVICHVRKRYEFKAVSFSN